MLSICQPTVFPFPRLFAKLHMASCHNMMLWAQFSRSRGTRTHFHHRVILGHDGEIQDRDKWLTLEVSKPPALCSFAEVKVTHCGNLLSKLREVYSSYPFWEERSPDLVELLQDLTYPVDFPWFITRTLMWCMDRLSIRCPLSVSSIPPVGDSAVVRLANICSNHGYGVYLSSEYSTDHYLYGREQELEDVSGCNMHVVTYNPPDGHRTVSCLTAIFEQEDPCQFLFENRIRVMGWKEARNGCG